ncbi:MAG: creatininase family protein [Actinomycetota bacterium]|nr:creatininase family protein [Actinomycetota bacterium]
MRLWDANWMHIEEYLRHDDRVLVPLGSTEQHGYLSLGVDALLCERASVEAAEGEGVPVLPALPFGLTPTFTAYPGTINLRVSTYLALVSDLLDSLQEQGFGRIMLVNGHGGNLPAANLAQEWVGRHPGCQVQFHSWLIEPEIWQLAGKIDEVSHASWVENLPAVRLPGVDIPAGRKPLVSPADLRQADPDGVRALMGDGPGGGAYQRAEEDTQRVWTAAVALLRERLQSGWRSDAQDREQ